jgi:hypothetical protein
MEGAQFQVGVIGEIGGIPAKCLIDILPDEDGDYGETIVDFKTTSTGLDDESIRKAIGKYKYQLGKVRSIARYGIRFPRIGTLTTSY